MPIFLVRGEGPWGALIEAEDVEGALYTLDEIADPGRCHIEEYGGPLALEFWLPVLVSADPRGGELLEVPTTPSPIDVARLPYFSAFGGDTGWRMRNAVLEAAFPATHRRLEAWADADDREDEGYGLVEGPDEQKAFSAAVAEDLGWGPPLSKGRVEVDPRRVQEARIRLRTMLLLDQVRDHLSHEALDEARESAVALLDSLNEELAADDARRPERAHRTHELKDEGEPHSVRPLRSAEQVGRFDRFTTQLYTLGDPQQGERGSGGPGPRHPGGGRRRPDGGHR